MAYAIDAVRGDDAAPETTRVAIIGGGIVGVSAALALAEAGIPVVLCEKGEIAGEQSGRNLGWCRVMGRDAREIPLMLESLRDWERMPERIGSDASFRRAGTMFLCETEAQLAEKAAWMVHAGTYGLDTRVIDNAEIAALMPGSAQRWAGALYTPSDGRAEPQQAAPALAKAAQARGAKILTNCAVHGLDRQGGRVAGLFTERGRIACDTVLLAGGAWSTSFCGNLGIRLPQLKIRASALRVAPIDTGVTISATTPGFGLRRRNDGGYTISTMGSDVVDIVPDSFRYFREFLPAARASFDGLRFRAGAHSLHELRRPRRWPQAGPSPFATERTIRADPYAAGLGNAVKRVAACFPAFAGAVVTDSWAGMIDAMPDEVPVMSAVDAIPGFFLATGFSGHGFGIGPAAGTAMAALMTGEKPSVDLSPFHLQRFD